MKARIPKHREFVINLEKTLRKNVKSAGQSWKQSWKIIKRMANRIYTPSFIEDNEDKVKALQAEYGFEYTIELK